MKTRITRLILGLVLLTAMLGCSHPQEAGGGSAGAGSDAPAVDAWPELHSPVFRNPQAHADVEKRVEDLLARMTLKEKVGQILQAEIQTVTPEDIKAYHLGSVLNGGGSMPNRIANAQPGDWLSFADSLYEASMDTSGGGVAIPIIWGTDAVHGHNNVTGATLFPHNIGLGAMRNPELVRRIGAATAAEVRATGIEWVFAPSVGVAQNDLWGRTYESYSEDPTLVRDYSAAMVAGLQGAPGTGAFLSEERVVATVKHFLADGGTLGGDDQGDARIDENELVRLHNAGYPSAIESGVQAVMASFSSWNGEKVHGNRYLLTEILKERMGFDGLVVGDWNGHGQVPGCTNDSCARAINAGIDLVMAPYDWKAMYEHTLAQVEAGEISVQRLNDAVRRILRVKLRAGLFERKPSERKLAGDAGVLGQAAHRTLARQAVRESLVLLKNRDSVLPINPKQTMLVAGPGADNLAQQSGGWSITWQGTGTTNDDFPGATSIYEGIRQAVEAAGGTALLSEDGNYEHKPDVAIVVFGETPYAEGQGDRDTLEFQPGDKRSLALLRSLQAADIPVVSVFLSGRPLWVNPELNASDAFVAAWLPGSEGAGVADLLIARPDGSPAYDFKGRLSFSWPKRPLQTKLNAHHPDYDPLFELGYGWTYASGAEGPGPLPEKVVGLASGKGGDIDFYLGRPLQPWNLFLSDPDRQQMFSGSYASLPNGKVVVTTSDKDVQEDALSFRWRDTWRASLTFEGGKPLDLTAHTERGVVSLDLRVMDLAQGGLSFKLVCGDQCERRVPFTEQALAMAGNGWQTVRLPLSCFKREGDDFSAVAMPFGLEAGGAGKVAVANIRFLTRAQGNADCPDYKRVSVTPSMLNEYWARDWWEPRHREKLARVRQGDVDLVMLGDSITQGWEEAGRNVWQSYYAQRKAINLGFGGDRTENVLWRLQHGEVDGLSPKAVVLMIGTNNTGHRMEDPKTTAKGVRAIVDELRERLPEANILLLAVFPREETPDAPMRKLNRQLNRILAGFADGKQVFFLDLNEAFLDEQGRLSREIMPDLLHPNEKGYRIWAEAMEPSLQKLLSR